MCADVTSGGIVGRVGGWSAGRTLAGQPLSSPQVAQWIAVAAGPLALMGLVWLMFGRTRRKEAERV